MDLHADAGQITRFVAALFPYAADGTWLSLRCFDQHRRDIPPIFIRPIAVNGSPQAVADAATQAADDAAHTPNPSVFAPPVCTFSNPHHARSADLANGLVLSVELDSVNPNLARIKLESILGPCTLTIESGSLWTDQQTGQILPNLHLHWRLSEPTTTDDEHNALNHARSLASLLAGGDPTAKPAVHPLRWPGSWNTKTTPRMAVIASENPTAEIHLIEAVQALEEAVEAAGLNVLTNSPSSDPEDPTGTYALALAAIPNADVHYNDWIRFGYAAWRASGGSDDGLSAWNAWSRKSTKYNPAEQEAAWKRIGNAIQGAKVPRTIGAGTIIYHALAAGWTRPVPSMFQPDTSILDAEAVTAPPARKLILSLDDLADLQDPEWLLHGIIPQNSLAVVYGPPKAGKSFIILSIGLHIAAGMPWFGMTTRYGAVFYIAGEGVGGLKNRAAAMLQAYELHSLIPFWIIPRAVNFRVEAEVKALADLIRSTHAKSTWADAPIQWIIPDTLARAMPGADENSAQDVGLVIAACDWLRDQLGAAVSPVHHEGKDETRGARGSSALRGAWDAAIRVTGTGKQTTLEVVEQKDAEAGQVLNFEMREINLGLRTSLVPWLVEQAEGDAPILPKGRPTGRPGILLAIIERLARGGEAVNGAANIFHIRREFHQTLPELDQEARKKALQRTIETLVQKNRIAIRDEWVTPI